MNQLVIVTGLSGSGKSSALNALEDLDYFAIDNLPIKLLEDLLGLLQTATAKKKIAIVMDVRDEEFLSNYAQVFQKLLKNFKNAEILFLDSSAEAINRRFSETRRKHPLSANSVQEGLNKEIDLLSDLKGMATSVIDTSDLNVHQLKQKINDRYGQGDAAQLQIQVVSFGYKHGAPSNCDLILDVRFLLNPHFVPGLKALTGLDEEVCRYINQDERAKEFIDRTINYLMFLIPNYAEEGKRYLSIGIGCTGGKHRSVYMTEQLAEGLSRQLDAGFSIKTQHQHLNRA